MAVQESAFLPMPLLRKGIEKSISLSNALNDQSIFGIFFGSFSAEALYSNGAGRESADSRLAV